MSCRAVPDDDWFYLTPSSLVEPAMTVLDPVQALRPTQLIARPGWRVAARAAVLVLLIAGMFVAALGVALPAPA